MTTESVNGAIEHAGGVAFDCEDATRDAAGFVPDFDGETAGADFEGEAAVSQRDRIFAVFQGGGAAASREKAFDGSEKVFGVGVVGSAAVQ